MISGEYVISQDALLDFGSREVRIVGLSQLDFGNRRATMVCGDLTISAGDEVVLKVRGPNGTGQSDGGNLSIRAERSCSESQSSKCVNDLDCNLGTCSLRLCDGDSTRTCTDDSACDLGACDATVCSSGDRICDGDADCSVGPCNFASRFCMGDPSVRCFTDFECNFGTCGGANGLRCRTDTSVSCNSDDDCDFGSCDVDVCAQFDDGEFRECSSDADCDDGQCTIGTGNITINSRTRADGAEAGVIDIRAAGDLTLNNFINANGNESNSDGGVIELEAGTGSLTVNDALRVEGGGSSQGGEIGLTAGGDIRVSALLNAAGGDFDGGVVEIQSDGSVLILADIDADSTNGEGFGGEINVSAGGDISMTGAIVLKTNGHQSATNEAGDAGPQEFVALGDISIGPSVLIEAKGAKPFGVGEEVSIESDAQNVTIAGTIVSSTNGTQGGGGIVSIAAAGDTVIASSAILDASGQEAGGGTIDIFAGRDATVDGFLDAAAESAGPAETVSIDAGRDVYIGGHLRIGVDAGIFESGTVAVDGCGVSVENGGFVENFGDFGKNVFRVGELLTVQAGGVVQADSITGENEVFLNEGAPSPVISGTVVPSLVVSESKVFRDCSECGDGKREGGETCDDGNVEGGDGCSADCQLESCIDETPGYPQVPLCDDGNGCTLDSCNVETGECDHVLSCDDGVDCTVDTCVEGSCVNTPEDFRCSDGSVCTDDICGMFGCSFAGNFSPCDDGLACTTGDQCNGQGACRGDSTCMPGEECSPASGQCVPEGAICGNGTVDQGELCDDGNTFWAPGQHCNRVCGLVACGDPNDDDDSTASDALFALNSAVGVNTCDECVCDVDASGLVSATDALRLLNFAISVPGIALNCPACD
jgi:cysteine-rich repeat protein